MLKRSIPIPGSSRLEKNVFFLRNARVSPLITAALRELKLSGPQQPVKGDQK
jgi:hypothetical protein